MKMILLAVLAAIILSGCVTVNPQYHVTCWSGGLKTYDGQVKMTLTPNRYIELETNNVIYFPENSCFFQQVNP